MTSRQPARIPPTAPPHRHPLGTILSATAAAGLLASCDMGPQSGWGFTLPAGEAAAGQQAFAELGCADCHSVVGVPEVSESVTAPEMDISLGGEVVRIATYGELVTSIINPSHRFSIQYPIDTIATADGESRMRNYNDVMTVSQLIDVVAFLQDQYELQPIPASDYPQYRYR